LNKYNKIGFSTEYLLQKRNLLATIGYSKKLSKNLTTNFQAKSSGVLAAKGKYEFDKNLSTKLILSVF